MIKLTKPQQKNNARIYAWLHGQAFAENSRDRHPRVPELAAAQVLPDYTPQYAQDYGAFFTPPDMARAALAYLDIPDDPALRVLEPAAGIGGLVYWLRRLLPAVRVDACELVQEYHEIGQKLFPEVNWLGRDAWDYMAAIEGQYDFVISNPPYGLTVGLGDAQSRSISGAKRGEHLFLELALRALKPDGQALIIAPANLITGLPKSAQKFFAAHGAAEIQIPLPGKFALTNIKVEAFVIRRTAPAADYTPQPCPPITDLYHEWRRACGETHTSRIDDVIAAALLVGGSNVAAGGEFRRYCRIAVLERQQPDDRSDARILRQYQQGHDHQPDNFPYTLGGLPWYRWLTERAATPTVVSPPPTVSLTPPAPPVNPDDDWGGFEFGVRAHLADLYRDWRRCTGDSSPSTDKAAFAWRLLTGQCRSAEGAEFRRYCRIVVSTYLTQGHTPQTKALVKLTYDQGGGQDPYFPDTGGSVPWHLYLSEPEPDTTPPPATRPDLNTEWAALEAEVAAIDTQMAAVETLLADITRQATPTPPPPPTIEVWIQTPLWETPGQPPRCFPRGPRHRQAQLAL